MLSLLIPALWTFVLAVLVLYGIGRLLGKVGVCVAAIAPVLVLFGLTTWRCRTPGICDNPGEGLMVLLWGALAIAWALAALPIVMLGWTGPKGTKKS